MGGVDLTQYGKVQTVDENWPSGDFLLKTILKHGGLEDVEKSANTTTNSNNNNNSSSKTISPQLAPDYWQASARWALMQKYAVRCNATDTNKDIPNRVLGQSAPITLANKDTGSGDISSDLIIAMINSDWQDLIKNLQTKINEKGATVSTTDDDTSKYNDLLDFLKTSKSNNRQLQWTVMNCAPGCQFNLHAHPNLELVYCIKGALHEIRMQGNPIVQPYKSVVAAVGNDDNDDSEKTKVQGPNLSKLERSWYFATVQQGEWLVNEVGSIHKSFTATSGDGCQLLVLWGGSHADIAPEDFPTKVNVQGAVDKMDNKIKECENCTQWNEISETFLPESERMQKS